MIEQRSNSPIVDSAGRPGYQDRSHSRGMHIITDGSFVPQVFAETVANKGSQLGRDGRVVVKSIVQRDTLSAIFGHAINPAVPTFSPLDIEAVAPLPDGNRHLVVAGRNLGRRQPIKDVVTLARERDAYQTEVKSPLEHVAGIHAQGYRFISQVPEALKGQLYALWKDTFGWEEEQVSNFAEFLNIQNELPAEEKGFWFTGIIKKDEEGKLQLVAAAMAQRFGHEFSDGSILIESTEWIAEEKGKGLVPAAVAVMNAQILTDLGENNRHNVFIYAECNIATGAYKSAEKVGMSSSSRNVPIEGDSGSTEVFIPNIHPQNVAIGDGKSGLGHTLEGEELELRDFSLQYLSAGAMDTYYSIAEIQEVRRLIEHDDDTISAELALIEGYEHNIFTTA